MSIATVDKPTADGPPRRAITNQRNASDKRFRAVVTAGAMFAFVVLALIAGFLLFRGFEVFKEFGFGFLTSSTWDSGTGESLEGASFGVAAMLVGSVIVALMAMILALPFVIGTALFLEYYIGKKLRAVLVSILDLMAAIPSIIYGLWGYLVLMPYAAGWAATINKYFGWIPIFKVDVENFDASPFISALVLGLMIIPIASSVTREVYSRAPQDQISAAYALGGSRWGALKAVVLPFGRSGLIGGMLLGLGRALGETVAVLLTLNLVFKVKFQVLASAGGNVASLIASRFGEAGPSEIKALMAAGLVLFTLTLVVNFGASIIVSRTSKVAQ
jgi:phosphate transport system permease protein